MSRPILLGMNNPLSRRPEHALYPRPLGCAGHRLYEMLRDALPSVTEEQYLAAFDRRNLLVGAWSMPAARLAAGALLAELEAAQRGRDVLVLGAETWRAMGMSTRDYAPLESTNRLDGVSWVYVPHPSGRNRWYNQVANRAAVGALLARAYEESVT